jgi:hypothetical protein
MDQKMPSIYVALDKNPTKYQSPMIEVEVKIDNQAITILIEYGNRHS